mgnify:CR=1 FL=1
MKLGISSYTYPWAIGVPGYPPERPMSALGLLDRARDVGVEVVQICENLPLDRLAPAELEALAERARELGISLEVGTTPGGREIGVYGLPGMDTFFPNVPPGSYYVRAAGESDMIGGLGMPGKKHVNYLLVFQRTIVP